MARNVFKNYEIPVITEEVLIKPPFEPVDKVDETLLKAEEEKRKVEEYTGPTLEDIQREAEQYRIEFESEKIRMKKLAQEESDLIFEEAQKKAEMLVAEAEEKAAKLVKEAKESINVQRTEARKKMQEEREVLDQELNEIAEKSKEQGYQEGYNKGFSVGQEEVDRLINKIHVILGGVAEKRQQILKESEAQVIDLVLTVAMRVVKSISESQKEVVIQNVKSALSQIKGRTDIVIRVNLSDLDITTAKMKEFQSQVEKVKNITIIEDATIEKGGCIIETDYGQIDARISSQLREIELKIRELSPAKIREA